MYLKGYSQNKFNTIRYKVYDKRKKNIQIA